MLSWAHRAALSNGNDGVGTVAQLVADDLIAQHGTRVTHADATRLRLPHVLITVVAAILDAATQLILYRPANRRKPGRGVGVGDTGGWSEDGGGR